MEFPVFTVFSFRTVEVNCVRGVGWQGNCSVSGIEIQRTDGWSTAAIREWGEGRGVPFLERKTLERASQILFAHSSD